MIPVALTAALAALITFGSIAIQDARRHAKPVRQTLALIAVCLGLFVGLVAIVDQAGAFG